MEIVIEFGNAIWAWFGVADNQNRANSLAAVVAVLLTILGVIGGGVWFLVKWVLRRPKSTSTHDLPTTNLDTQSFLAIQRDLKADLEARFLTGHVKEQDQLRARIAELQTRIANPESAIKKAQEQIVDLEALLERSGSAIGGDRIAEAREALERGDYSIADEIFAEIEARRDMEVQEAARATYGRGEIAEAQVRWADAAQHFTKAARLDPSYDTLIKAGEFLLRAGDHAGAIWHNEQLVQLAWEEFGSAHPKLAAAQNNLAESYRASGRFDEAEPLFREALEIGRKVLGDGHPDYAIYLNNLAGLLWATGRYDEAEPLLRAALEITSQTLRGGHPAYATRLNNLAVLLRATGRHDEAELLYREALEIDGKTLGEGYSNYAAHLNNLARLLEATGRSDEVEPLFREALKVCEAALGADHPDTQTVRGNLERFLAERKD